MNPTVPLYLIEDALWARSLTKDVASQLVEQTLEFFYGDMQGQTHSALLRVCAFKEKGRSGQSMQQFRLELMGPTTPQLPAQTYRARHVELGDFAIFISPVGKTAEGLEYEACFSHEV